MDANPLDNLIEELFHEYFTDVTGNNQYKLVANISNFGSRLAIERDHFQSFAALATEQEAKYLLNAKGDFQCHPLTAGPYPTNIANYRPFFQIQPLSEHDIFLDLFSIVWETANKTIVLPDQGFLMTYGLIPRIKQRNAELIILWDNPLGPEFEIVQQKITWRENEKNGSKAFLKIKTKYLHDYASLIGKHIICVYFGSKIIKYSDKLDAIMDKDPSIVSEKGRLIHFVRSRLSPQNVYVNIYGVKPIAEPGISTIRDRQKRKEAYKWPGISDLISKDNSDTYFMNCVYIADKVLDIYEKKPQIFSINPESGSVHYYPLWGISDCNRILRDLIMITIKDIYHLPPNDLKHWHDNAVDPPSDITDESYGLLNVASRSKRIVFALADFGEMISNIGNKIKNSNAYNSKQIVKLSKWELDNHGWWENEFVYPITFHIPLDLSEEDYLKRSKVLAKLIIEGFSERIFREIVISLATDSKLVKNNGSLKLLEVLVQKAVVANESGLDFYEDSDQIEKRRIKIIDNYKPIDTHMEALFCLYELRQLDAHRIEHKKEVYSSAGIDPQSNASGWGEQLDKLYDDLYDSLKNINEIFKNCI